MKYLHTMVRVADVDKSLDFYVNKLGLKEIKRMENSQGRFTLIFLAAPGNEDAQLELTYNWDPEAYGEGRNFGHLAYEVDDIYATCERLMRRRRHHQPAAARRLHGLHPLAGQRLDRAVAEGQSRCPSKSPGRRCRMPASGRTPRHALPADCDWYP